MCFVFERCMNPGILSIKPYVPGRSIQEVIRDNGIRNPIKMASNENPLGSSPLALKAIKKAAEYSFQYPEVICFDLREKLTETLKTGRDHIIIGNGADGVIYALGMCMLNDGDEVIIPEISFPLYESVSRAMRANVVFSKMKEYTIDLKDIYRRITDKTKIIWLCNPNNPTGTCINDEEFQSFFKSVPESVMVVHDEVYFDFADSINYPDTLDIIRNGKKNLFIIRSFSKIYGLAGVRIGYGVGHKTIINFMYRTRPPFDVSVLAQAAGIGALQDKEFYKKSINLIKKEKEYVYKNLDRLGLSYIPSYTNFILINIGQDCTGFFEKLLSKGIIVRPVKSYNLPRYIRITIGLREHNIRLIRAMEDILKRKSV